MLPGNFAIDAGTANRAPAGDVFGTTGGCRTYDEGASVVLTASHDVENMFVEWSGALTGSADSGTITMSMDHDVSALFDIAQKGEVIVRNNTDRTFTVSPDFGYDRSGVAADNASVGAATRQLYKTILTYQCIAHNKQFS